MLLSRLTESVTVLLSSLLLAYQHHHLHITPCPYDLLLDKNTIINTPSIIRLGKPVKDDGARGSERPPMYTYMNGLWLYQTDVHGILHSARTARDEERHVSSIASPFFFLFELGNFFCGFCFVAQLAKNMHGVAFLLFCVCVLRFMGL